MNDVDAFSSDALMDIRVRMHNSTNTQMIEMAAPWSDALKGTSFVVLIKNRTANNPTGLYYRDIDGEPFRYVLQYSEVKQFVVDGGTIDTYIDLTVSVPVPTGANAYLNGEHIPGATTIGPGRGMWSIVLFNSVSSGTLQGVTLDPDASTFVPTIPSGQGHVTVGFDWKPVAAGQFVFNPVGSSDQIPKIGTPVAADLPWAAPKDSPALIGAPTSLNPTWPAAYDDPNGQGGYKQGGVSGLATRDLVKNAVAGALGNYSGIFAIDGITQTTIPPESGGALWVIAPDSDGRNAVLPDLSAANYPQPGSTTGLSYNFTNVTNFQFTLVTGQNQTDQIMWGADQLLTEVVINPGETLGLTIVWWNHVLTWFVSGGTALAQARDSYIIALASGQTSHVPVSAMSKKQIIITGALTQILDGGGLVVPTVLGLPTGGEFTVVNQTTGGQVVNIRNSAVSGGTIPLIPGANAHVVTGDYGIQSASGAIGGAYELYAAKSTATINLSYGPLLYDVLVITDDPGGDMTVPVTFVFDPQFAKSSGRWAFYNDLKQASPQTITIADTFGNSTTLPVGTAKSILYTPDGKIVVLSSST